MGLPLVSDLQDAAAVDQAQNFLSQLDSTIQQVAREGEGSARSISLQFKRGEYILDEANNEIRYEIETGAEIISPHSTRKIGNLVLSAEADASVKDTSIGGVDCYLMENEYLEACIKKISESAADDETRNVEDMLIYLHNKDLNTNWTTPSTRNGNLTVYLSEDETTADGSIWTSAPEIRGNLGVAEVVAHVEVGSGSSLSGLDYKVRYQLLSGADFLQIKVEDDA